MSVGEQVADYLPYLRRFARAITGNADDADDLVQIAVGRALKRLDQRLKDLLKEGATTKANIKIEGDTDLRQQYVMAVFDTCKRAGFGKLHFVPPPVLKSKLMR